MRGITRNREPLHEQLQIIRDKLNYPKLPVPAYYPAHTSIHLQVPVSSDWVVLTSLLHEGVPVEAPFSLPFNWTVPNSLKCVEVIKRIKEEGYQQVYELVVESDLFKGKEAG